jgi:5-oxoprolinase (ATP-hydrolysing)
MKGGEPGKPGNQKVIRRNGDVIKLNSIHNINMEAGDKFVIETPGGGGFGKSTKI